MRNINAIKIQTVIRRKLSLIKVIEIHTAKPICGGFADVFIGEDRNLKFKIPNIIREDKRRVWFAAVKVGLLYKFINFFSPSCYFKDTSKYQGLPREKKIFI